MISQNNNIQVNAEDLSTNDLNSLFNSNVLAIFGVASEYVELAFSQGNLPLSIERADIEKGIYCFITDSRGLKGYNEEGLNLNSQTLADINFTPEIYLDSVIHYAELNAQISFFLTEIGLSFNEEFREAVKYIIERYKKFTLDDDTPFSIDEFKSDLEAPLSLEEEGIEQLTKDQAMDIFYLYEDTINPILRGSLQQKGVIIGINLELIENLSELKRGDESLGNFLSGECSLEDLDFKITPLNCNQIPLECISTIVRL